MKKLIGLMLAMLVVGSIGIASAEEIIWEPNPVPDVVPGSITITEGANLISMPILPLKPFKVIEFINAVTGEPVIYNPDEPIPRPEWEINNVAVFKNGQFEQCPKDVYNMIPGEAYLVEAKYLGERPLYAEEVPASSTTYILPRPEWRPYKTITLKGKAGIHPVALNLNKGANGVSISPRPDILEAIALSDGTTSDAFQVGCGPSKLSELAAELRGQEIKATEVVFWNREKQEWEKYPLSPLSIVVPLDGEVVSSCLFDRPIRPDEGFILITGENGLYIPGLQPPPIENRVTEIGKVVHLAYLAFGTPPPFHFGLALEGGEQIPLMSQNEEIERLLEEVADSREWAKVSGVMTKVTWYDYAINGTREAEALQVDLVERIEAFELKGVVERVLYIPEEKPPYSYQLIQLNEDGSKVLTIIPLVPFDYRVDRMLCQAASYRSQYVVKGITKGIPDGIGMLKVFVVESISPQFVDAMLDVSFRDGASYPEIQACLESKAIFGYSILSAVTKVMPSVTIRLGAESKDGLYNILEVLAQAGIEYHSDGIVQDDTGLYLLAISVAGIPERDRAVDAVKENVEQAGVKILEISYVDPQVIYWANIGNINQGIAEKMAEGLKQDPLVANVVIILMPAIQ